MLASRRRARGQVTRFWLQVNILALWFASRHDLKWRYTPCENRRIRGGTLCNASQSEALAEQSALAHLQASLQMRFAWFLNSRSLVHKAKKYVFEHHCLHIERIFRENAPFCTLFLLFSYRTFPVVVSCVVEPRRTVKSEKRRALSNLFSLLINRTRVKKNACNIRLVCCIITLKQGKSKSFRW